MAQSEATKVRLTYISKKIGITTHSLVQALHKAGIMKGQSGYLVESEEEPAWLVVAKVALEAAMNKREEPSADCEQGSCNNVDCDYCNPRND
jgi:hypothetical protein